MVCIVDNETNLIENGLFSLGNGLLIYPITEADVNQVSIYLPGQNTVRKTIYTKLLYYFDFQKIWYDIRTFTQHNGSETILVNVDMESVIEQKL